MDKTTRQLIGIDKWIKNDCKGILNYSMRFGKTRVGLLATKYTLNNKKDAKILVIVPSVIIKEEWFKQLKDVFSIKPNLLYIATISELQRLKDIHTMAMVDLVIVDECHKFVNKERIEYIDGTKFKLDNILMLTGTLPDIKKRNILTSICPVVDTITEEEALVNKWISPFIEYNIPLELSEEDKVRYARWSIPIRDTLKIFNGTRNIFKKIFTSDYDIIIGCISGKNYKHNDTYYRISSETIRLELASHMGWNKDLDLTTPYGKTRDDNWNPNNIYDNAKEFILSVRERNKVLINNVVKLDAVLNILRLSFPTTIIFNESTDFADTITHVVNREYDSIPAICYHSNIKSREIIDKNGNTILYNSGKRVGKPKMFGKTSLKKLAIEGIIKGGFKLLCTARALDEGLNIPNIEQVITTGGTANPIQYKQRKARGRTVDIYNPNKVTKIFNLYFDNFSYIGERNGKEYQYDVISRDKTKLELRQEDTTNVIKLNNLAELVEIFEK